MALPELDMDSDLEATDELPEEQSEDDTGAESDSDVDPMFAADMDETGLDLDDKQLAAFQRAVLGLISNMGGGMPPSGGAPAAPF